MKIRLPNIPRLRLPRRKPRLVLAAADMGRRGKLVSPAPLPLRGTLGVFRAAALWGIGILIAAADGAAFSESYRGLFEWAEHHSLAGFWAAAFPLQVDVFIVVGELVLFIAMADRWGWRDRAGAWTVALLGLAVSVAGNVGHVAAHDLQSRGTAAVPPVAAFAALWLGLGVLKRVISRSGSTAARPDETGQDAVLGDRLEETLGLLTEAIQALAARSDDTVSSAAAGTSETVLLGELLEAVREVGARIGGMTSSPVPSGAEHAALIAYRATLAAGNPYSMNALQVRFGLTRSQAEKVRAAIADEHGHAPADINGYQANAAGSATSSSN